MVSGKNRTPFTLHIYGRSPATRHQTYLNGDTLSKRKSGTFRTVMYKVVDVISFHGKSRQATGGATASPSVLPQSGL